VSKNKENGHIVKGKKMNEIAKMKKILEDHERRIKLLEGTPEESKTSEQLHLHQKEEIVAKKANVSVENVKKVYDLEKNSLTLTKLAGADDREKTKNATLLVLLGYKYFYEKSEVLSQEIRRNVAEHRIPLNNFASYLKEITPSLIRIKGKVKSPKTTYRITTLGEANARDLLRKICEV